MDIQKLKDFNSDPVIFCSKCYSLKIIHEDTVNSDCCGECGCSDLSTSTIDEWEKLYKNRYGHRYIEKGNDIRRSPIFLMSNEKLKTMVFKSPDWREICQALYPTFPNWLSRTDSVILLFAKLCQENRIDELRVELINRNKNGRFKESKRSKAKGRKESK